MFYLYDFEYANNYYTSHAFLEFCIIGFMFYAPHKRKTWNSAFYVVFLALIVGWELFALIRSVTLPPLQDALPSQPSIVMRAEWGARPLTLEAPEETGLFNAQTNPEGVLYYSQNLSAVLNTIVIHHSAFPNAGPREIQDLHMDRRGFADIAYHYLIAADGTIFEGRKINIRGAHVQGYNTGSVGIVLLGNFNEEEPTETQLSSLRQMVNYLRYSYDIRYLAGHKDYPDQSPDGTKCPGDNLYPLLPELANSLGMKYSIDGYVGPDGSNN